MRHSLNAVSFNSHRDSVTNLEKIRVTQSYSCANYRSLMNDKSKLQSYSYN